MNIFDILQSKKDKEFVIKDGSLEFEVFADILEKTCDLLYLTSLFKLGKIAINYLDYRLVRKLHFFLAELENIKQEKIEKFLSSLSEKNYKRIKDMMTQLLYTAEEDGKATLMGKIYRSRLLGEINDEMMLRLCFVVNKAFLADLDLQEYVEENESEDYLRDNLNALGLLQDLGSVKFPHQGNSVIPTFGNTIYKLNSIGKELLRIKKSN